MFPVQWAALVLVERVPTYLATPALGLVDYFYTLHNILVKNQIPKLNFKGLRISKTRNKIQDSKILSPGMEI